jgi:hypothetical protein
MNHADEHLSFLRKFRSLTKGFVTFYPQFALAIGGATGVNATLFACNFLYWEDKQKDPDRWIYKHQEEIKTETGLNRDAQIGARKKLKELGILEEKEHGIPNRLHYRFHWEVLDDLLHKHYLGTEEAKSKEEGEAPVQHPPILAAMAQAFENVYTQQTKNADYPNGQEFAWGTKSERGKQFGKLKALHDLLVESVGKKKTGKAASQNGGVVPDGFEASVGFEEIMNAWQYLLDNLPTWYREKRLSPDLLHSDYNKIILEITTNGNRTNQSQAGRTGKPRTSITDTL